MQLERKKRRTNRPELNLVAMIDVVFLLLIFFMCTSSFNPPEDRMPAQLPKISSNTQNPDNFDPVMINLEKVPGGVLVTCDGQRCETFDNLRQKLRRRRQIANVRVIITGRPEVPYRYMIEALDSCYMENLTKVAFGAGDQKP